MRHQWLKYSNVYINHDPVMTLTKFMARSTWVAYASELGKLLKCHLKEKANRKLANGQNIEDSEKRKWPKGFICPCTGVKYHNIQTCLLVYAADLRCAFTGPLVLWFCACTARFVSDLFGNFIVGFPTRRLKCVVFQANDQGVGVVGVVETDFLNPIHNKQDFERTDKYRYPCFHYCLIISLMCFRVDWNPSWGIFS